MAKPRTIKDTLEELETNTGNKVTEMEEVKLIAMIPPIEKMDPTLSSLVLCRKLSLSTNCIDRIANLHGLKNLKILSLTRNNIRSLAGLDAVGDSLQELWLSYNQIESMRGIMQLRHLKILYMSNNKVKEWREVEKLAELKSLQDLLFVGNPIHTQLFESGDWQKLVVAKLPTLSRLDGATVIREEDTA